MGIEHKGDLIHRQNGKDGELAATKGESTLIEDSIAVGHHGAKELGGIAVGKDCYSEYYIANYKTLIGCEETYESIAKGPIGAPFLSLYWKVGLSP